MSRIFQRRPRGRYDEWGLCSEQKGQASERLIVGEDEAERISGDQSQLDEIVQLQESREDRPQTCRNTVLGASRWSGACENDRGCDR